MPRFTSPRFITRQNCRVAALGLLMLRLMRFLLRTFTRSSPSVSASTLFRKKSAWPPERKLRWNICALPTSSSLPGAGCGSPSGPSSTGGVGAGAPGRAGGGSQAGRSTPAYTSGNWPRASTASGKRCPSTSGRCRLSGVMDTSWSRAQASGLVVSSTVCSKPFSASTSGRTSSALPHR